MSDASSESTRADAARRPVFLTVLVAALGYFVDIYDLILFGIVRAKSLKSFGLSDAQVLDEGVFLFNAQMIGMLLGGIFWGILADKRGRLSVLFGSIVMYSAANIANGFAQSVGQYAILRFVAGVGLAGELGAGITLVSEIMSREARGFGTTVVASVGILGAVVAALVGDMFSWQTAYIVGGVMGFLLLLLRVGLLESGMFESAKLRDVSKGDFFLLFRSWARTRRYLSIIFMAVPIWYVIGILISFSPEIAKAMGVSPAPTASTAIMLAYIGLSAGDLASGSLSQVMKSRKKVVGIFIALTVACIVLYFSAGRASTFVFYTCCTSLGFATGYWAVFVTMASEQFGTNIRATATTTAPNFVRGALVPLSLTFRSLKESMGVVPSAMLVGAVTLAVAVLSLWSLEETYGKNLDFVE